MKLKEWKTSNGYIFLWHCSVFFFSEDLLKVHYLFQSCLFYTNWTYCHTSKLCNFWLYKHLHDSLKSIKVFEPSIQELHFKLGICGILCWKLYHQKFYLVTIKYQVMCYYEYTVIDTDFTVWYKTPFLGSICDISLDQRCESGYVQMHHISKCISSVIYTK